jgi:hypothetical protein
MDNDDFIAEKTVFIEKSPTVEKKMRRSGIAVQTVFCFLIFSPL